MSGSQDIVVVGAGLAGLTAAWRLAERLGGARVQVLESSEQAGGPLSRGRLAGVPVDAGTESFAVRDGRVAALLDELGLGERVVAPLPGNAWVGFDADGEARFAPLPATSVLGIPGDLAEPGLASVLGGAGLERARRDAALGPTVGADAATLGQLVRARMGAAVVDRLLRPVAGGVYSSDPDALPVSVVPGLIGRLAERGSLAAAVADVQDSRPPGAAVAGISGGMAALAEVLVARLRALGVSVRTGVSALGMERDGGHGGAATASPWLVRTSAGAVRGGALVMATPAAEALRLLSGVDGRFGSLRWPQPAVVRLVALAVDAPWLDERPRGTGMLVAPGVPGVAAKGLTHVTGKWEWVAHAFAGQRQGRHAVRLSYGHAGERTYEHWDAGRLIARAVGDAAAMLGGPLSPDDVVDATVRTWGNAQPGGAAARAAAPLVSSLERGVAPLAVVGAWRHGTGVARVMPGASDAADDLADRLGAAPSTRHGHAATFAAMGGSHR